MPSSAATTRPWLVGQPRSLVLARAAWLLVAGVAAAILVVSLQGSTEHLLRGSPGLTPSHQSLEPATLQALEQLGVGANLYLTYRFAMQLGFTLIFALIGSIIFWRRPDDWMTVFVSLTLIAFSVTTSSIADGMTSQAPPWPWLINSLQAIGTGGWLLLFLLFPDGWWVPRWTCWLALVWVAVVFLWLLVPTLPFNMLYGDTWLQTPVGSFLVAVVVFNTGVYAQVYRYRHTASAEQRQQTKWVLFGFVATSVAGILRYLPPILFPPLTQPGLPHVLFETISLPITGGLVLWLPLGLGFAILRHRLWEIDILINRTLVYGVLSGSVVGLYVVIVGGLGVLFQTRGSLLISLLATGVVAVIFQPLREHLQRAANRLLWGERDDPYAVLSRLGRRLEIALAPDAVLPTVVSTIAEALKLPYAAVALTTSDREAVSEGATTFAIAATTGVAVAAILDLPLIYRGEVVGKLILGQRSPKEPFSPADHRLLGDIAHQVGVAAHAVRLHADLQRSRERLVIAREEERRRLRRDLHDGLGPTLAAHTLKVGAARALVGRDPSAADRLLGELETDIDGALQDVRRLVYNLRPPALDQWGLVGAIRESTTHYSPTSASVSPGNASLRISLDAPPQLPPLPAAVEVAAYRIIQEAQTNVIRHAHSTLR